MPPVSSSSQRLLVTGGAGFIGCNLVRQLLQETEASVINLDKLTYAGNLRSLEGYFDHPRHQFHRVDICEGEAVAEIFARYQPTAVIHLAAESHVDRSIDGPDAFMRTNIFGTYTLLQVALQYWRKLTPEQSRDFRFLHVSTDEVYGSLGPNDPGFSETSPYAPHSPYSASKASSDHLARSWQVTYGLPILITNCSNNYGPYQFPEKLIPLVILKCLRGEPIPVYGDGRNIRDWLYVSDHCSALRTVLGRGVVGETYNIGGNAERENIDLVRSICGLLDELRPGPSKYENLITYVTDRPAHDFRYAIDATKIRRELDWKPEESFESGIRKTVEWYLSQRGWWEEILCGDYRLDRLGLGDTAIVEPSKS